MQDYDPRFYEIIVVDDHSEDATEQVVRKFKNKNHPLNIELISLRGYEESKKTALQRGIKQARGEVIIMTDADCRAGKKYLSTVNEYYRRKQPRLMVGPVKMNYKKSVFSKIQALEFLSLIFTAGGSSKTVGAMMANGANLIADRKVFSKKMNGDIFLEKYASGDDMFLLNFVKKTYGVSSVLFIKHIDAIMETTTAGNFYDFIIQRKRWVSKSKSYTDPWLVITALFVLLIAIVQLISLFWGIWSIKILSIAAIIWLVKILIDYIVLYTAAVFFKQKKLLWWFLPVSIVYPFYVVSSSVLGLLSGYSWKGRKYSRGR